MISIRANIRVGIVPLASLFGHKDRLLRATVRIAPVKSNWSVKKDIFLDYQNIRMLLLSISKQTATL